MERDIHNSTLVQSRAIQDETGEEAKKRCPFAGGEQGFCFDNCAMHTKKGCAIITGENPVFDGKCPFDNGAYAMTCSESCAFYADGCAMIKRKG